MLTLNQQQRDEIQAEFDRNAKFCPNEDCPRPDRIFWARDPRRTYCSKKCAATHREATKAAQRQHLPKPEPRPSPGTIFTD